MDYEAYKRYLNGMKKLHQSHPDWAKYPGNFYISDYIRDSDSPHAKCLIKFAPATYAILSEMRYSTLDTAYMRSTRKILKKSYMDCANYSDDVLNFVIKIVAEAMGKTCLLVTDNLPELIILPIDPIPVHDSKTSNKKPISKKEDDIPEKSIIYDKTKLVIYTSPVAPPTLSKSVSNTQSILGNLKVASKDIYNATSSNKYEINRILQLMATVDADGVATIVAYQDNPNETADDIDHCDWTITKLQSRLDRFMGHIMTKHLKTDLSNSSSPNKLTYKLPKQGEYVILVDVIYKSPLDSIKIMSHAATNIEYSR